MQQAAARPVTAGSRAVGAGGVVGATRCVILRYLQGPACYACPEFSCALLQPRVLARALSTDGRSMVVRQECTNPISDVVCSADRLVPVGDGPFPEREPAGVCSGGNKCKCKDGYTTGRACELLTRARTNESAAIRIDGWRYLAKTCWGANSEGLLKLTVSFKTHACYYNRCKNLDGEEGIDYGRETLPDVVFYASYGDTFAIAAAHADSADGNGTSARDSSGRKICEATGAIYQEPLVCQEPNGTKTVSCTMTKTFNVMNRGEDATLVYLVLAKCGVNGWADWDIETSVEAGQDQNNHGVCGARGVDTAQRCISDSGGTCAVQVMTDRRHSPRLPCVSCFCHSHWVLCKGGSVSL